MSLNCQQAAVAVSAGKIIAYPTEAIYGLGCDPDNELALDALLQLKIRDRNKGLILVANDWSQIEPYVGTVNEAKLATVMESWPGPVTWIMPASKKTSQLLTGGRDTLAVRISDHPVVRELCGCCNSALVSTSANISGQPPFLSASEIEQSFADTIAGVVQGELGGLQNATSIFDMETGVQLR